MKQCPKCGGVFEPSIGFCPKDGTMLTEAPPSAEQPKRKTDPGMGTVRELVDPSKQAPDALSSWGLEPSAPVITSADAVASGTFSGSGRVRVAVPGPSPTFAPVGFVPVADGSAAAAGQPLIAVGGPPAPAPALQPLPPIAAPLQTGPSGVVPQALSPSVPQPFPQLVAMPAAQIAPFAAPPAAPVMMPPAPVMAPPMAPVMAPPMAPAMAPPMAPAMAPPMAPAMAPVVPPAASFQPALAPTLPAAPTVMSSSPSPAYVAPSGSARIDASDDLDYQIPRSGGNKGLIIAAVVIVILGGLGGGVYFFLSRGAASLSAALSDAGMTLSTKPDATPAPVAAPQADAGPADTAVAIIPIPELESPKPTAAAETKPEAKAPEKPEGEPKAKAKAPDKPKPEPKAKAPDKPKPEPKAKAPDKPKPEPKAKAPDKPKPEPKARGKKKKLDSSTVLDPFK